MRGARHDSAERRLKGTFGICQDRVPSCSNESSTWCRTHNLYCEYSIQSELAIRLLAAGWVAYASGASVLVSRRAHRVNPNGVRSPSLAVRFPTSFSEHFPCQLVRKVQLHCVQTLPEFIIIVFLLVRDSKHCLLPPLQTVYSPAGAGRRRTPC